MTELRRGLNPFDPEKHARFATVEAVGFSLPAPTYPIDRTEGIKDWGMDGNGPDPSLTVNGGQPVGDCGVCAVPAHSGMLTAVLVGLDLATSTMSADNVVTLYFSYEAQKAGVSWRPPQPGVAWTQADIDEASQLDLGVDLGDWLLWLFHAGFIEGFVALPLEQLDAGLAFFNVVVVGGALNPNADQQFSNGQPFDVGPGDEPDPQEGHATLYLATDGPGGTTRKWCTWGATWDSTPAWAQPFPAGYPQQAFAVVTRQEAEAKGFLSQFEAAVAALHELGGTAVPTPGPGPAPAPAPPAPGGGIVAELRALALAIVTAAERIEQAIAGGLGLGEEGGPS